MEYNIFCCGKRFMSFNSQFAGLAYLAGKGWTQTSEDGFELERLGKTTLFACVLPARMIHTEAEFDKIMAD